MKWIVTKLSPEKLAEIRQIVDLGNKLQESFYGNGICEELLSHISAITEELDIANTYINKKNELHNFQCQKLNEQNDQLKAELEELIKPNSVDELINKLNNFDHSIHMPDPKYKDKLSNDNDRLRDENRVLRDKLQLALNAFENNWCIDWNEIREALAQADSIREREGDKNE